MANENLPAPVLSHDFTQEELDKLSYFENEGMPGIAKISDQNLYRWLNLYMVGKSYEEIAQETKSQIELILCVSKRNGWASKKRAYHEAIATNLTSRLMETRLQGLSFLSDVIHFYHKNVGKNIKEYLETGNEKAAEKIDLKNLDKYYKAMDMVEKLMFKPSDDKDGAKPINQFFNFFGGTTIKKVGDGKVEIEQKEPSNDNEILELEKIKEENDN